MSGTEAPDKVSIAAKRGAERGRVPGDTEAPDKVSIAAKRGAERGRVPGDTEAPDKVSIAAKRGAERGRVPGDTEAPGDAQPMRVLVYSHDAGTREVIRLAIGRRPAPDVPPAEIVECATEPALFRRLDRGGVDIMILDGEAQPAGGMGVCRQAKDEIYECPPVLLVVGRADDGWLATWSRADAVVSQPIDPAALAGGLAGLMRLLLSRRAGDGREPAASATGAGHDSPVQA